MMVLMLRGKFMAKPDKSLFFARPTLKRTTPFPKSNGVSVLGESSQNDALVECKSCNDQLFRANSGINDRITSIDISL